MTARRETRSICLIHTGAIGDFVLALSVVQALRRRCPGARVEVLGHPGTASLAVAGAGLDAVTSVETVGLHALFAEGDEAAPACARYLARFDLFVNMLADEGSLLVRRLGEFGGGEVLTLDPKPDVSDRHVTEAWSEALTRFGLHAELEPPRLCFDQALLQAGRSRLQDAVGGEGRVALLHPGSGGRPKCWPVERFLELARRLGSNGWMAAFMIGPVELDLFGGSFAERLGSTAPVISEPDLVRAASIIAGSTVVVGNDAGMTHVAAAVGTPTVAIFGATDPTVWRPLGPNVRVVCGSRPGSFEGATPGGVIDVVHGLTSPGGRGV